MMLEDLKTKAKTGEIKLEDLEVEEILKFLQEGFINPTLSSYFNISIKEVKKIRRQKNLFNADLEDLIRNLIVLIDYARKKYVVPDNYLNMFTKAVLMGFGIARGKRDFYFINTNIDWENLDTEKEIKERKIDYKYRIERITDLKKVFEEKLETYNNHVNIRPYHSENYVNKEKKKEEKNKLIKYNNRNKYVSNNVLYKAHYLCELNHEHSTFINRFNNQKYMEAHHLIPLKYQSKFEYNLDVEANIVCLCSNCHRELHYGVNYKKLLEILYYRRKEQLELYGIGLNNVEELFEMYDLNNEKELV